MKATEIERIKQYIAKTGELPNGYAMGIADSLAIAAEGSLDGLILAFRYGQAKGYRAAKAGALAKRREAPSKAVKATP